MWLPISMSIKIYFFQSMNGTYVGAIRLEIIEEYFLKENDIICLSCYEKGVLLQLSTNKNVK
jgi:hypothetical protein